MTAPRARGFATTSARVLFGLGSVAIVVLSVLPVGHVPELGFLGKLWDKAQHALAYACVAACVPWAWGTRRGRVQVAGALLVLGLLLEGVQARVPGRSPDPADAVANGVGIAAGMAASVAARRAVRRTG